MNQLIVPEKYIGIPYVKNGRDSKGADCIGLASLYTQEEQHVKVTHLPADTQKAQNNNERYRSLLEDIPLNQHIPGDVLFFSFYGRWHCGVYIGYGKMLHITQPRSTNKKTASVIVPIPSIWQRFYIGAVRTQGKKEIILPPAEDIGTILLIISIVLTVASVAMAIATPRPNLNFGNDLGSPNNGFDIPTNTISNEVIYPTILGKVKVKAGNIFWYKDEADGTRKMFVAIAQKQIHSISDVRINDIPIGDLPGCSYTAYLGTPDQIVDSRAAGAVYGLRNLAYLAITVVPSEKISGTLTVTCQAEGNEMPTWSASAFTGSNYTKNPAAHIRYLLTLPRYLGGGGVAESELDDDYFGEIYDHCAELIDDGEGGTHARHECDIILDARKPIQDVLLDIMSAYGMHLVLGDKIRLRIEKTENTVHAFNMDNIVAGSFKYYYASKNDTPNRVDVQYTDPDQNDVKIPARADDDLDQADSQAIRPLEPSYLCIRRFAEASRRAQQILNDKVANSIFCEFDANIDALHCEVQDVVVVTHVLSGWTAKPFRVVKITEEKNHKRHLTLQEYNASIYNDAPGSVVESYDYGTPPNAYAPVTDVGNLVISESTYYRHKDGTVASDILVSFSAPSDSSRQFLDYYQIELKKGTEDYRVVGRTNQTSHTIYAVEDEVTYQVKVKTISINRRISDGTESAELTVLGKQQSPDNVTGFDVYQQGNLLYFTCDPMDEDLNPDFAYFEVRKGTDWDNGQVIISRADLNKFPYPVGEVGYQTYMIKAYDRSGNPSAAPAYDSLIVIPPPDANFINNFDLWSVPLEYKLHNLELVQVPYHSALFNRMALAFKTATTWEEREAEGKTWDQQEADGGLLLDGVYETSGYMEMVQPFDLGTIFSFKIITSVNYKGGANCTITLQIATSDDGITYSSFADVDANTLYSGRYLKFKIVLASTNSSYTSWIYDLLIYINAPQVKKAYGQDIAVPIGGLNIVFDVGFTRAPRFFPVVSNGVAGYPSWDKNDLTKDGVLLYVKAYATGSPMSGAEISYNAEGT